MIFTVDGIISSFLSGEDSTTTMKGGSISKTMNQLKSDAAGSYAKIRGSRIEFNPSMSVPLHTEEQLSKQNKLRRSNFTSAT